ncbi:MAG TPA: hypothetical protein VKZ63_15345, partial [Kofleriaceae bacterium]|nr:hypothetical protein [Kofleriaceae bacterium]
MLRRRGAVAWMTGLLIGMGALGACKQETAEYCCTIAAACDGMEMRECADPSRPFCDNFGEYGEHGRTCIPSPGTPC